MEETRAVGTNGRELVADLVHPVGIEKRWRGCAVGHAEHLARSPCAPGEPFFEPGIGCVERCRGGRQGCCRGGLIAVDGLEHGLLHLGHDIGVEEAVHEAHFELNLAILGD